MSAEALNANPTILNPADLPTRRRQSPGPGSKDAGLAFLAGTMSSFGDLQDPFGAAQSPPSSSGSDSEDDAAVEAIDEQEIYGMWEEKLLCGIVFHFGLIRSRPSSGCVLAAFGCLPCIIHYCCVFFFSFSLPDPTRFF